MGDTRSRSSNGLSGPARRRELISIQHRGNEKLYFFNPVPIHEIYVRWIRKFEPQRLDALHNLKTKLERQKP